ncbi:MAG: Dihydrodipicolinate synthetase [Chloroflexi bacterium]|nr:Dihydrodipicolinate synthetase [Chloroflexota bacterium]
MITAQDLHGVMGMMPAFATSDGWDIHTTSTIDVEHLREGVDRIIGDGINVIATTGSFGECHTLLFEEFVTLAHETVAAVKKRVPLFIGCTSPNSREVVRKMQAVREAGADGVLVGMPYYFPSSVENVVQFYHDIAEMFPDLGVMIYHNPTLHHVTIPVEAFHKITQSPNVVGMKDGHRDTLQFMKLMEVIRGKISVFVNQVQYYPYGRMGAAGCWSIDAWMGPWPFLALRDAVDRGDDEAAQKIIFDLSPNRGGGGGFDLRWRETAGKVAMAYAGYCQPGPLRPPFVNVPESVDAGARKRAEAWNELCARYRPLVEAARVASLATAV